MSTHSRLNFENDTFTARSTPSRRSIEVTGSIENHTTLGSHAIVSTGEVMQDRLFPCVVVGRQLENGTAARPSFRRLWKVRTAAGARAGCSKQIASGVDGQAGFRSGSVLAVKIVNYGLHPLAVRVRYFKDVTARTVTTAPKLRGAIKMKISRVYDESIDGKSAVRCSGKGVNHGFRPTVVGQHKLVDNTTADQISLIVCTVRDATFGGCAEDGCLGAKYEAVGRCAVTAAGLSAAKGKAMK